MALRGFALASAVSSLALSLAACREPAPQSRTNTTPPSAPSASGKQDELHPPAEAQTSSAKVAEQPAPPSIDAGVNNQSAAVQPPVENPPLVAEDGTPLPQTDEEPSTSTDLFRRRIELVAQAIITDDPSGALPAFFPVVAYQQVKDVQKPERDWKQRLIAAFERDIHNYHRELGRDASSAKFVGIEVPEQSARWMKPGSEGNRVGYFRVLHSRLKFALASGKERTLELTSLISWRGQWYVVHLNGFK